MGKQRKKPGPPPMPKSKKRACRIAVNLTPAELRQLRRDAAEAGLSTSAYLIRCWQEQEAKP